MELCSVVLGQATAGFVIANYYWNLAVQFPALPAMKQIKQTVVVSRHQNPDALTSCRVLNTPLHLVRNGDFLIECRSEGVPGKPNAVECPLHSHKEQAQLIVLMLVSMEDICSKAEKKS